MASRHHSLDLSELADVTDMLAGFEEHNSCELVTTFTVQKAGKARTIVLTMMAFEQAKEGQEAKLLGSVKLICSAMNLKTWNSVLTRGMYTLDFQLALHELGHAEPKKA